MRSGRGQRDSAGARGDDGRRRVFRRLSMTEDVDREIAAHLDMAADELVAAGWSPIAAAQEAERRFGSRARVRRECLAVERRHLKRARRGQLMEATIQDFRYAFRTLSKSPGFTLVAVVTLALGIGANTTVFSLVNGVLLKPLPYDQPEELVWVAETSDSGAENWVAWANFRDWRGESRTLEALAAYDGRSTTVLGGDQPLFTPVATVSQDFWSVFPFTPRAGRLPGLEDHKEGGAPVAVVSESLAVQALGGEAAVGRAVEISGVWHEVVGVAPAGFDFPSGTQLWTPAELTPKSQSRTSHNWKVVGRLAEGMTVADAFTELDAMTVRLVAPHMGEEGSEYLAAGAVVTDLRERLVGDAGRHLILLLGAAAFVLLVACANLVSTLLARGATRRRELAVRSAVGASRTRIVRQLLSETALLAWIGGVVGIGLAWAALQIIRTTSAGSVPRMETVTLDVRVLLFTLVVTLVTATACGIVPALRGREDDQATSLRATERGNAAYRGGIWGTLVASEVALALILLTGSGLLIRSLSAVLSEDAGFDGEDVVVSGVSLSGIKYPEMDDHRNAWEEILSRAEALPGVSGAGLISVRPLSGFIPSGMVHLDGDASIKGDAGYVVASAGVFEALDIPLLRGRTFNETDGPEDAHVVVVSQSFVEVHWPGKDPIGRRVSAGGMDSYWNRGEPLFGTVVGVVADVRYRHLTRAGRPVVYWNFRQRPSRIRPGANLVVESASGDAGALAGPVRRALLDGDPDIAPRTRLMRELVSESVGERRFTLLILAGFAGIGLLLAGLGIFGVVSYAVAQRTREMGIRLALGATGAGVRRLVLKNAMVPVAVGMVAGVAGAWGLARVLAGLLYEVAPGDPVTFMSVCGVLLATGFVASWIPTVRGTRVDPLITMRGD